MRRLYAQYAKYHAVPFNSKCGMTANQKPSELSARTRSLPVPDFEIVWMLPS